MNSLIMAFVGMKKRTVSDMDDKYIKLSDAKNALADYIAEQTVSKYGSLEACREARFGAEGAMKELDYVPAAEVAPKSEVERWRRNLEAVLEERAETKSEVAREIFEEIEKLIFPYMIAVMPSNTRAINLGEFAELKKKYTEGET